MRTIAITNQKGGCGKTTTAVNLAAALARQEYRTLLIDLDPQGHATLAMGLTPQECERTIFDVILNPSVPLPLVVCASPIGTLDVAPSNVLLSGAESHLTRLYDREYVLRDRLEAVRQRYHYCIIDCSPSLSLLTLNAVVAAAEIIVPVQTHYYAIEGLRQMLETVDVVRQRFHPELQVGGILLTLAERRTLLARQVEQQMREYFGDLVFQTVIHRCIRLAEAPGAGQSIFTYDPCSSGATEYTQLAKEIDYEQIRASQTGVFHL
ncbi:MAG TPA: ParA family protein [Phycisphaerales bacterium]|nr:ParA family protein [Phycisphaerales bacterium]